MPNTICMFSGFVKKTYIFHYLSLKIIANSPRPVILGILVVKSGNKYQIVGLIGDYWGIEEQPRRKRKDHDTFSPSNGDCGEPFSSNEGYRSLFMAFSAGRVEADIGKSNAIHFALRSEGQADTETNYCSRAGNRN